MVTVGSAWRAFRRFRLFDFGALTEHRANIPFESNGTFVSRHPSLRCRLFTDRPRSAGRGEEGQDVHNDRSPSVHHQIGRPHSRGPAGSDHRARHSRAATRFERMLLRVGEKTTAVTGDTGYFPTFSRAFINSYSISSMFVRLRAKRFIYDYT